MSSAQSFFGKKRSRYRAYSAALSFDAAGDGDVAHIFLDHASSTVNAAWETTLRVDAGGDTLTWTLSLAGAA